MADVTIVDLPAAGNANDTDIHEVEQSGVTRRVTRAQILAASLRLDGTTLPTSAIDFNAQQILNIGAQTNSRLAAARNDSVQETTFNWGGTTGGTGAAYTVTLAPAFTGGSYRNGQQVRFIAHTDNTSTTPTLNVGTPGAATMVHRNGAALQVGAIQGGSRYTAEFDGTNWRVLDAGGYMEQALYDQLYPVNKATQITSTTAAPVVPAGVTATWTRYSPASNRYLLITPGGPNVEGGSSTSGSESGHQHGAGSLAATGTADATITIDDTSPGALTIPLHTANWAVSGTSGAGSAHTHTIEPPFYAIAFWRRTA